MVVIEETFVPPNSDAGAQRDLRRDKTFFIADQYQCQPLSVTVPEIDTSKSLTPIGKDL